MDIGVRGQGVAQSLAHFALEVTENAADLLEGKAFATQFGDDRYLDYFTGEVNALMPVVPGRYNVPFIPPLQLAQADA